MTQVELIITKEDFKGNVLYIDNGKCPLAIAARRILGKRVSHVGVSEISGYNEKGAFVGNIATIYPRFTDREFYALRKGEITEFKTTMTIL